MAISRSVAILFFCSAITLLGQGLATGTGSITGRVFNSLTGEIIAGASVRAWQLTGSRQSATPKSTSQSDGTFRFDALQPGQYMLLVEKEGFVPAYVGPKRRVETVQLKSGDVASGIEISMLPDGGIAGKVVDDNGQPVSGVQVQALSLSGGTVPARLQAVGTATTSDKKGGYLLPKLSPGNYYLVAVPDSSATKPRKDGYQYVATFFPDAASLSQSSPILVRAGESSSADVKLCFALVHRVAGKIGDLPDGVTQKYLRLTLAPAGESRVPQLRHSGSINTDGTFSLTNIPSGSYELMLRTGRRRGTLLSRQDIEVGADDVSGIVLRPMEPIALKGTVTQDGSGGLPLGNVSVQAIPTEEGRRSFANMAADGTFALSGLEPESYFVTVRCSRLGMYVSALTLNGQDILNKAVDLSGISTGQINVVVRSGAGDISGTASDNPSMVILQPALLAPDGSNVQIGYTQPGGVFDFSNVPPGDYVLYATERSNPSVWMQPGYLRAIENFGMAVHLDENGKQQVQLTLAPKALLENEALRLGLNFD